MSHFVSEEIRDLKVIQNRKELFCILLCGFLPLGFVVLISNIAGILKWSVIIAYLIAIIISYYKFVYSKCPSCDDFFYWKVYNPAQLPITSLSKMFIGGTINITSKRCMNCGFEFNKEKIV